MTADERLAEALEIIKLCADARTPNQFSHAKRRSDEFLRYNKRSPVDGLPANVIVVAQDMSELERGEFVERLATAMRGLDNA